MATQIQQSPRLWPPNLDKRTSDAEQPKKVLLEAVIALLLLVALFGVLIWLAAQSEPLDVPYEYWMP
jgi:hypothetical protein